MSALCSECRGPLPAARSPSAKPRVVCSTACGRARGFRLAGQRWHAERAASPDGIARRVCAGCGIEKEVRRPSWPFSNDAPIGAYCFLCFRSRKRKFDRDYKAAERRAAGPSPKVAARAVAKASKALARALKSTEGAPEEQRALYLGAEVLNLKARDVAKEMRAAIEDPEHPWHFEALMAVAERILPLKTISAQAVAMARDGEFGEVEKPRRQSRPRCVLTVGLTTGPKRETE